MKRIKTLVLVILATVGLLSFTMISKSSNNSKKETVSPEKVDTTTGGLSVEDANQWD